jgi:hypothetical protein
MTAGAAQTCMCTGQSESRNGMVKTGWIPAAGGMAGSAVRTELATMRVLSSMAGKAVAGCSLEDSIRMTIRAGYIDMSASQPESRQVVVEVGRFPGVRGMAGSAVGAKLAAMRVLPGMAGIAGAGCTFEDPIGMTTCAGHIDMLSCQLESGQIVVENGRFPTGGGMAGATIFSELTAMCILAGMAGIAVRCRSLKDVINMATQAGNFNMLTG